jgi:hypothetical protein
MNGYFRRIVQVDRDLPSDAAYLRVAYLTIFSPDVPPRKGGRISHEGCSQQDQSTWARDKISYWLAAPLTATQLES